MLYCKKCKKEVVIYGVSYSEGVDEALNQLRNQIEKEGKLILFNPPPFGKFQCPRCFSELSEVKDKKCN